MDKKISLWYDPDVDILEVLWDEAPGTFEPIESDERILERIDENGEALGFMIQEFSTLKAESWIDFHVGGRPRPGLENMTVEMAAREIGVSGSRMRQLLAAGRIQGARKLGRDWIVPTPVRMVPGERGPIGVAGSRPAKSARSSKKPSPAPSATSQI
ncbi:MAG: DUF2283 domain-containing protein [SAR202 cluster bacterium]|nr:DUF2283 domain-containing protein [SAR202 cluster bacterium]